VEMVIVAIIAISYQLSAFTLSWMADGDGFRIHTTGRPGLLP
jgi:hypothetical protein